MSNVLIVGLGGTGSHIIQHILDQTFPVAIELLVLVDHDIVESPNLKNQIYS